MTDKDDKRLIPKSDDPGFFRSLNKQLKLIMRLMADGRVHTLLKLLPVGSLIYLISPFDLPGPIDDAVVLGLGLYTFVELCPDDVVEEHRAALESKDSKPPTIVGDE